MTRPGFGKIVGIVSIFCVATALASSAQTLTTLFRFSAIDGEDTNGALVQGTNGNFYGTAQLGGANHSATFCTFGGQTGCGTIFQVTPAGKVTKLHDFCSQTNCADGAIPAAGLVLGSNGNFYGTTNAGANSSLNCNNGSGCGTVFEITPAGKLTTLYSFCSQPGCTDGSLPFGLQQGTNGNFYGVTATGGIVNTNAGCPYGCGTIFEITPAGKLTKLYSFCSQLNGSGGCADGQLPLFLMQAANGNFYGTTYGGGIGLGNVFEMTPAGKLTSIYSLCSQTNCIDGQRPMGPLVQGANGSLYGTALGGNLNGYCEGGCGTVYEISLAGNLVSYYDFCAVVNQGTCTEGANPEMGMVLGTDGNFYGTTVIGGNDTATLCANYGCGTVFQMTPAGKVAPLYSFCAQTNCADGAYSITGLMQSTNGTFYGFTEKGARPGCVADGGCGTVFSLSMSLGPFVEANPDAGRVGRTINILGNHLTGTTSVTFNGTPATFTVVSGTLIKAVVPTGATTGTVQVTEPGGTLSSNVAFKILL